MRREEEVGVVVDVLVGKVYGLGASKNENESESESGSVEKKVETSRLLLVRLLRSGNHPRVDWFEVVHLLVVRPLIEIVASC